MSKHKKPHPWAARRSRLSSDELINEMAEAAHNAWWQEYLRQGFTSRKAEWGEEFMVPFSELSERGKEFDRMIVRAIRDVMLLHLK